METLDESLALLSRMSAKQGVQSTLVLTRDTGAIVRSQGILAPDRTTPQEGEQQPEASPSSTALATAEGEATRDGEEIARHVWKFVRASGELVQSMDAEDELRLLRIRTRRNELVIVPSEFQIFFLCANRQALLINFQIQSTYSLWFTILPLLELLTAAGLMNKFPAFHFRCSPSCQRYAFSFSVFGMIEPASA
jgi:dynein light chain roadblock-type